MDYPKNCKFYENSFFNSKFAALVWLFFFTLLLPTTSLATWTIQAGSGGVYNIPLPLNIYQPNQPTIEIAGAHYETHPFDAPVYYDIKIGRWIGNNAWEVEFIHHKVYLENTTEEVPYFSISHGYNLLMMNRAWLLPNTLIWRIGAGIVIAHPESQVRGASFNEKGGTLNDSGYYVSGATLMTSVGKRIYFTKAFFLELEGKITASFAQVPVAKDGYADAPNIALHAIFNLGYDI